MFKTLEKYSATAKSLNPSTLVSAKKYIKEQLKNLKLESTRAEGMLQALSATPYSSPTNAQIRSIDARKDRLDRQQDKIKKILTGLEFMS